MDNSPSLGAHECSDKCPATPGPAEPDPPRNAVRFPKWQLVAVFGFLIPSLVWILSDRRVWPWDQAWYGEVSVELWFKFTHHIGSWIPGMLGAFGSKAPGVAFLGQLFVPIGRLFGSIEPALLLSVLTAQAGTLSLIYRIGKRFSPERFSVALAGVAVAAAAPLFVALSHQYVAEPLQLFGVAYFYFLAACSDTMRRETLIGHLLIATSTAMLAKVTSPLYCAFPGFLALATLIGKFRGKRPPSEGCLHWKSGLFMTGVILSLLCVIWYIRNFHLVLDFVRLASSSEIALQYGSRGTFQKKLITWLNASQTSLAFPAILAAIGLVLIAAVGIFLVRHRGRVSSRTSRLDLLAVASLLHILAVLAVFSMNINEETRYLLPLLPAVATILMWSLTQIRVPAIAMMTAGMLVVQWGFVCSQALGITARNPKLSYWLLPVNRDRQQMDEITAVIQATSQPKDSGRYNISGVEIPWLNANSLAFYSAKAQLKSKHRCYYTSLGYAAQDIESAWTRMNAMNSLYFVSLSEAVSPEKPDFLNQLSIPVLHRIQRDPSFVPQAFESNLGILIYRREGKPAIH